MSMFVTQAVESSVTVLVFAKPGVVLAALEDALVEKGIAVEAIHPDHFTPGKVAEAARETFYKILWVLDDTQKGTDAADQIFQFVFSRDEPILILTATIHPPGDTDINISPQWKEKRSADQQLFKHLRTYLPTAYIQVVTDWLDQPDQFISPLRFIRRPAIEKWQSGGMRTEDVITPFLNAFMRPHRSGLETLQLDQAFTIRELSDWYDKTHPAEDLVEPVEVISVEELDAPDTPDVADRKKKSISLHDIPVTDNIPEVKAPVLPHPQFYRNHASPQQVKAETLAQTASNHWQILNHPTKHIDIVPYSAPKIVNRQHEYELSIHKIKQRFDIQKKLRPLSLTVKEQLNTLSTTSLHESLQPLEQRLELTIQQLFGTQRTEQREQRFGEKVIKTAKTKKRLQRQRYFARGMGVLAVLVVIFVSLVGSFWGGRAYLFSTLAKQVDAQTLKENTALTSLPMQAAVRVLSAEVMVYQAVMGQAELPETAAVLNVLRDLPSLAKQQADTQKSVQKALAQAMGKETGDVFTTLTDISSQQQTLYTRLSVSQSQLQAVPREFLSDQDKKIIDKFLEYVQSSRKQLATFEQVNQLLPALLAKDSKRRVAFLFQDNQELRPSGGTMQGVYVVTIENGKIIDQQAYTPEQVDGQRVGHLQAPTDYQKYFDQKEVSFIDVGWSPDFTTTAKTVSNYLDRSLSKKPDIVVGLTTHSVQNLLAAQGQIQLTTPPELITNKNLFERLEAHPEPDYLYQVFSKVLERSLTEPEHGQHFLQVIGQQLQEGQAFLASNQPTENDVLNSLGWAGQVSTPQCPGVLGADSCQVSTMYQLESSIGTNKVNALVQRSITHAIRLTSTMAHHQRVMSFTNSASSTRWPLGAYRSYIRFYVPKDALLQSIKIGTKTIDLNSLDKAETPSGQFFGVVIDVPIQSTVTMTVDYTQPFNYSTSKAFAFFDQKQAGTLPDQYSLSISPDGIQPTVIAPKAELRQGKILFTQPRDKHQFVGVKFR